MLTIDPTTKTWSQEEVLGVVEVYLENARAVFLEHGDHEPMTFIFGTKKYETGEDFKALGLVPVQGNFDEDSKADYAEMLRKVLQRTGGVGIIFITEMWMVSGITGPDSPEAAKWRGRLHEHPDRAEYLMLSCEHARFGCRMWAAQILRPSGEPGGKPELGPWLREGRYPLTDPEPKDIRRAGRFVNMLAQVS